MCIAIGQTSAHELCLSLAECRQWRILTALETALGDIGRLTVANQNERCVEIARDGHGRQPRATAPTELTA